MTRQEYKAKVKASHEKIYKMYLDGMDKKTIARNTGYSESYVDVIIRKAEGTVGNRRHIRHMNDADKDRTIKLRKEGRTIKEIADEIGFSAAAVQRYLKVREEEEKEKAAVKEIQPLMALKTLPVSIPPGTVLYETVREDGTERKIKWTLVRQYPHHALFISQYGKKRCFPNVELMSRGIYK